jgi:large subunit ribosomal protein L40
MAANQTSPLFRLLTPLLQTLRPSATASTSGALRHIPSTSSSTFLTQRNGITTTSSAFARPKGNVQKKDPRITLIRYHLQHPKTPRPLRLSRMRGLRHWTIHRAWMLYQRNLKEKEGLELERYVFCNCLFLSCDSRSSRSLLQGINNGY